MKFNVCDIFKTIQGEGRFLGRQALFLRLWGCNLRCEFCDDFKHKDSTKLTYYETTELVDLLKKELEGEVIDLIVITGGEPTLQNIDELKKVLVKNFPDKAIAVETNGFDLSKVKTFNLVTFSPKRFEEASSLVAFLNDVSTPVDLKFVVDLNDNEKARDTIRLVYKYINYLKEGQAVLENLKIYISPINENPPGDIQPIRMLTRKEGSMLYEILCKVKKDLFDFPRVFLTLQAHKVWGLV